MTLIIGIKCRVTGDDLIGLCRDRAGYHRTRARVYKDQLASMKEHNITGAGSSARDPSEAIKAKQEEHIADAQEMEFVADHILGSAEYELGIEDLRKLGIARKGY